MAFFKSGQFGMILRAGLLTIAISFVLNLIAYNIIPIMTFLLSLPHWIWRGLITTIVCSYVYDFLMAREVAKADRALADDADLKQVP